MDANQLPMGLTQIAAVKILRHPGFFNWSRLGETLAVPADTGVGSGEITLWSPIEGRVNGIIECIEIPTSTDHCSQTNRTAYGTQSGHLYTSSPLEFGIRHQQKHGIHSDTISQVAWSPDGEKLATVSHDQTICILSNSGALRRIQSVLDRHNSVRWSPTGREIAVCGAYYGVKLFQAETGNEIWGSDRSVNLNFHDIAWSCGINGEIAIGMSDGRVRIISSVNGSLTADLEWHEDAVISVAYSSDGRLLFSLGMDNQVRIWDAKSFARIAAIATKVSDWKRVASISCHPTKPLLALPGDINSTVRIIQFDADRLLSEAKTRKPASGADGIRLKTRAKVALIGQSEVGKTQVFNRLCGGEYAPGDTTHGVSIRGVPAQLLDPSLTEEIWKDREVLLWDLGGQKDYQLIHQLFLHGTTLALVMCDPTRREVAYHDVETWSNKLNQQSRGDRIPKILVGTKVDADLGLILNGEVSDLCSRLEIKDFVPTSAKVGAGFEELGKKIIASIDWARLERVVRDDLFQLIRDKLEQLRIEGKVVITVPALIEILKQDQCDEIADSNGQTDEGAVNVVVTQLSLQGVIAETRLADMTRALVLQISEIERYAGALLLMASNNPDRVPAIDEQSILRSRVFPGIMQEARLPREQEQIVVEAVVQLLLQNGLCLRHEGMLVFPSKVTSTTTESPPTDIVELFQHPDFSGAIENIYATLITSLSNGRRFGRIRLRPGRVEFVNGESSLCAVACISTGPGRATLRAFSSETTSIADRTLFYSYIQEHFKRMGIELRERLQIRCSHCNAVLSDQLVRGRIERGLSDIACPVCETRHDLTEIKQHGLNIESKLAASRIRAEAEDRAKALSEKTGLALTARPEQPQEAPLHVLHISDLHISSETDPHDLLGPLILDLGTQGIERLDYVVISGDITNKAGKKEYEKAYQFVSMLLEKLCVTATRTIIVPGNHDVDWETQVYSWRPKRSVDSAELIAGHFSEEGAGYLIRMNDKYSDRFRNFSENFFDLLKLTEYPLESRKQYSVDTFLDDRVQFISLNSSELIDEFNTERSNINLAAVSGAMQEALRQAPKGQNLIRICVFHHPPVGNDQIFDTGYLTILQQGGVHLCLHGHVHEERLEVVNSVSSSRIHAVGAGTLGAVAKHRPESTPRIYNLLRIDPVNRDLTVFTRAARKTTGAWDAWCVWPDDASGGKRGWFKIALPPVETSTTVVSRQDDASARLLKSRTS